ncbi:hypothetical protein DVH24_012219 [Malus domestica]|uniref:Protein arginine N-methyltransferase n=1 Tax=Malus domestica TaxID=3750 RepID=A0A498HSK1_MALDO|nr:hypothetical protein DVH24_012219 [Malus domestica]
MPLGQRAGDKSESRYCGVETEFNDDMPHVLAFNLSHGSFDFILAPLMDPAYRPSLMQKDSGVSGVLPFAGSDLVLSPSQCSGHVIGKVSSWIDLDSEDEILRCDSETTLKQEIAWASHLSLQACLLPAPRGKSCANYARCVNQLLQGLSSTQLWLRLPLVKSDSETMDVNTDTSDDSWDLEFISPAMSSLPSVNSLGRWFGESVRAAIFSTDCFLTNARGYPCLSKRHQNLVHGLFNHSMQIVLSGEPVHSLPKINSHIASNDNDNNVDGVQKHPLRPYLYYVGYLYQRMDPLLEQERLEIGYRDYLQSPLQPLMDNLEAQTYETFEKDTMKYIQYQRAICKALQDRVPDDKASSVTTVLMVVGAGRGPLVRASLQAAEETGRKLKVYAVEKNPNAVVTLHSLVKLEGWENFVSIISCDMRYWDAPEKADILVSELLGSFGDNELSPECLDGAQRLLKDDGILIPSSYTSFIQPVTASKLYNDVKSHKDIAHFETAYVVKLHNIARLALPQPVSFFHWTDSVFTFDHSNRSTDKSNNRFPIFFPLRTPITLSPGASLELHFWRCCHPTKAIIQGIIIYLSKRIVCCCISLTCLRFLMKNKPLNEFIWIGDGDAGLVRMVRGFALQFASSQQQRTFILGWALVAPRFCSTTSFDIYAHFHSGVN